MASASAFQRNEEAKLLAQNDGPVASRLRSRYKIGNAETSQTENRGGIGVNNQSDKPRQLSKNQKDKSNNSESKKRGVGASTSRTGQSSADKQKSNDSKSKCSKLQFLSSCTSRLSKKDQVPKNCEDSSKTKGKQVLKTQPPMMSKASQPQSETKASSSHRTLIQNLKIHIERSAPNKSNTQKPLSSDVGKEKFITLFPHRLAQKPIEECSIHHIRWKGPGKTSARWNCALCEKDIACLPNENERKPSIYEENERQFSFFGREREEWGQYSPLPETSVLPCSHVFHSMCLSEVQLIDFSDPPCPICLSMS